MSRGFEMSAVKDAIDHEVSQQFYSPGSAMARNYRNALTRIARLAASEAAKYCWAFSEYDDDAPDRAASAVLGEGE